MRYLSRRGVLGSAAAVCLAGAPRFSRAAPAAGTAGPPVARIDPVTESYFGTKVTDPYRWMEAERPEWQHYVKAQGAYAAQVLASIPGRDALAAAVSHDTSEIVLVVDVQLGGSLIFTEVRPVGANTAKLFVRDGVAARDRELIDPDKYAAAGSHDSLDWWQASPDGSHVVFGLSAGGGEQSILHVLKTSTGKWLPEAIDRTADAEPSWLPDSSGFFYNRLQPGVSPDSVAYEEKSVCWFHRLNTDPKTDIKVLGQGSKNVAVQDLDFPGVIASPTSPLAIGVIVSGVQNELALYAAPLADATTGTAVWTPICTPADKVTGIALCGQDIFLLTHKDASRYRIFKATAAKPAFATAVEVVPQSNSVIRGIAAARDGLYILDLDAGLAGLRRLGNDGRITTIKLPFAGAIDEESFYADPLHDGTWFVLEGWVRPAVVCHVAADGSVTQTDIAPKPQIDVSVYTSEEVFATAADGVKIPLSIVYRKGLKRDGQAPLLLEAYGAYGITLDPFFIGRWLPFLDLGGVFAIGHVRGGGELGEDWHLAGKKLTKPNTWRDMIACAEYLIAGHYTSTPKLAILGGSAGGITVGRFLTERPELAAVVISAVGVSDAMRSEFSPNGPPNIPEFGTVTQPDGFKALYAMDAVQHVKNGVRYPSVLLTTGLHDPRVSSWEPTKMTARLQAATASSNPILLRVESDAGHGIGSTRKQRDLETADMVAFILWRTGDKRYQPASWAPKPSK
jgi:prolyl oligopeptidase